MGSDWPEDHRDISDDTILNACTPSLREDPTTARYDRILQFRAKQATDGLTRAVRAAGLAVGTTADNLKAGAGELAKKLEGVMETIHRAADRVEANLTALGDRAEKNLKSLSDLYERAGRAQARLQVALIVLTAFLAAATGVYAGTTWLSVQAMREVNTIARQSLEMQARTATQNPAPHQAQSPAGQ